MTVIVDATPAQYPMGVGVVARGFLDGLSQLAGVNDVIVLAGPGMDTPAGVPSRRVGMGPTRAGRLAFQRLLLPVYMTRMRRHGIAADRLLLLDAYTPLIPQRHTDLTVFLHDVLPMTHAHYWSRPRQFVKARAFTSLRRPGVSLLTSTAHNAAQIHRLLGIQPQVVRYGCGQLRDRDADELLDCGSRPRDNCVLYIGAIEERKNLHTLLHAFSLVKPKLPPDARLLVVGSPRERYGEEIKKAIGSLPPSSAVQLVGPVSRHRAVELVTTAAALVFPSHAEGFGLPVLEALAAGTPVVASDIPEIRTWTESTVVYAPSMDACALADGIAMAVHGAGPPPREGQELARQYRWRSFAHRTLAVASGTSSGP